MTRVSALWSMLAASRLGIAGLAISLALGLLAGMVVYVAGFDPPDADIKYDWLATRAAWTGDAYAPVLDLAKVEGVSLAVNVSPGAGPEVRHPRTPGALLVMAPLGIVSYGVLFALSVAVSTALLAALVWYVMALLPGRLAVKVALGVALGIAAPATVTLRFSGQTVLVAVLLVAALVLQRRNESAAGLLVALAGVLKVFPLLILIPWVITRKRRAISWTILGVAVANLAGLVLPGVDIRNAFETLSTATRDFVELPSNASLGATVARLELGKGVTLSIIAVLLIGGVGYARLRAGRFPTSPVFWLTVGLVALPLSWVSYDVVLMPAVAVILLSGTRENRLAAGAALTLWVLSTVGWVVGVIVTGSFGLLARILVLRLTLDHRDYSLGRGVGETAVWEEVGLIMPETAGRGGDSLRVGLPFRRPEVS